ncbi:histidine/lysine/arginine/ornithine ABC transporter ATP-binding protein [Rhodospirillum rubrum]|nr:ATP-binding cassette domain-containing protein [Rhodospirillum rubrum]MBK1664588.1 histidine/lysine/arginine/ornithine ABC transporter ATP-binding protein [Rhodospirillum rubrum]MBK1676759.1 histidine/lysine/arginine/ornithine ABC transporter ATP-binding protein [Rhodospirillum rubrum]
MAGGTIALQVKDIHKTFGRLEVLKGISLTARDGDVISILGSSGSGKSTFLRCINLLEAPDRGEISLRGQDLALRPDRGGGLTARDARQLAAFRARIGFVFQSFNLWPHLTILENVMEAPVHVKELPKAQAREKAMALLAKVGIAEKRDHYPAHLSGGQQQRAAIARALAMEPEVILFDEPTSALDPELVAEVLGVIRALAEEGRTMLIVTHEMTFARDVSSEVVFLHQGHIEEQGPPAQMFSQPRSERVRQFLTNHLH